MSVASLAKRKGAALVLWEDPKQTAALVSVGTLWFGLIGWMGYSSLTIICYVALFHLVARLVYRVLVDLLEKRPAVQPPDDFITEEDVVRSAKVAADAANAGLRAAYMLAFCNYKDPRVFKWMAGLYAVALVSKLLGTTGVFFLAFMLTFSVPKIYAIYHVQIDQVLEQASAQATRVASQIRTKARKHFSEVYQMLTDKKKKVPNEKHH